MLEIQLTSSQEFIKALERLSVRCKIQIDVRGDIHNVSRYSDHPKYK